MKGLWMRPRKSVWVVVGLVCVIGLASPAAGVEGIAISARRSVEGDPCFGVGRVMFGDLIRHDIRDGKVVKSAVLHRGRARGARIGFTGKKVAFLKLDGRICVIDADGKNFKELANARNHNGSAMDWPMGDWVYYTQQGSPPAGGWREIVDTGKGGWGRRVREQLRDQRMIRRINVVTGEDQPVGRASHTVWQLSLTACATKGTGKFAITGALLDFANPSRRLSKRGMPCGVAVSPSGSFVCEMSASHADLMISDWGLNRKLKTFAINQWRKKGNDGRKHFYRPRWAVNSDKWITLTQGTNGNATIQSNMVVYNWMDGRQIQVTDHPLDGKINDEGEDFWLANVANDFSPEGYAYQGEAPYTVKLGADQLPGKDWRLDYGDLPVGGPDGQAGQTKVAGAAAAHTYTRPGLYTIVAKKGGQAIRRRVHVLARGAPRATVWAVDRRRLLVAFDEPVRTRGAKVSLASGTGVKSLRAAHGGEWLLMDLAGPAADADTITLAGIVDRAQKPNALVNTKLPLTFPAWPSDRTGLMFLWETDEAPKFYVDPGPRHLRGPERIRPIPTMSSGALTPDRFGAMVFESGGIYTARAADGLVARCRQSGQFSFEATLTPARRPFDRLRTSRPLRQTQAGAGEPGQILSCKWHMGTWQGANFAIYQKDGELRFNVRHRPPGLKGEAGKVSDVALCDLPAGKRAHVAVTYASGVLIAYLNGKEVSRTDRITGRLTWDNPGVGAGFHLGGYYSDAGTVIAPWKGKMEGVALYSRALTPAEVSANAAAYAAKLALRKPLPRVEATGELVALTRTPKPTEILPYRNALVVHEYAVRKVLKGAYGPERIRVAHWGLLNLKPTPIAAAKVGQTRRLVVERFSDHPELEGQCIRNDLLDDFDLKLHVVVTPVAD